MGCPTWARNGTCPPWEPHGHAAAKCEVVAASRLLAAHDERKILDVAGWALDDLLRRSNVLTVAGLECNCVQIGLQSRNHEHGRRAEGHTGTRGGRRLHRRQDRTPKSDLGRPDYCRHRGLCKTFGPIFPLQTVSKFLLGAEIVALNSNLVKIFSVGSDRDPNRHGVRLSIRPQLA